MISYTLENLKKSKIENIYNIFRHIYTDTYRLVKQTTYVKETEEMRLDKISYRLYGSIGFVEDLMFINNIYNSFNLKKGDKILYSSSIGYDYLRDLEKDLENLLENISKPNKNTRIDPVNKKNLPPTIKPKSFQNLTLDKKNGIIKLNGKLS